MTSLIYLDDFPCQKGYKVNRLKINYCFFNILRIDNLYHHNHAKHAKSVLYYKD